MSLLQYNVTTHVHVLPSLFTLILMTSKTIKCHYVCSHQVDFDNAKARAEEEAENANSLRAALAKAQADLQALKSRYDKDLMSKTEELEELWRRLNARIAELEDLAEQQRARAAKLDKEKNKLSIEVRELSVELEAVSRRVSSSRL